VRLKNRKNLNCFLNNAREFKEDLLQEVQNGINLTYSMFCFKYLKVRGYKAGQINYFHSIVYKKRKYLTVVRYFSCCDDQYHYRSCPSRWIEWANCSAVFERAECNQSSSRRVMWNCVWCFATRDHFVAITRGIETFRNFSI
jgi:hypothetical protein